MLKKLVNVLLLVVVFLFMVEVFAFALDRSPTVLYHAPRDYAPAAFGSITRTLIGR